MELTFAVLAEPNRLHIIDFLHKGPHSVNEIVTYLGLKQPLVSKHLRILCGAGIVRVRPRAQQRIYELEDVRFKELGVWLDTFADVWTNRLEAFDDYLQTMDAEHHNGQ
jgi:DNA-binding transcriptional ArsR family regulator